MTGRTRTRVLAGAVIVAIVVLAVGILARRSDAPLSSTTSAPTGSSAPAPPPGASSTQAPDPGPGPSTIAAGRLALTQIATVSTPVALAPRAGTADLYVAEQAGRVRRLRAVAGSPPAPGAPPVQGSFTLDPDPVLDLTGEILAEGERGLLGITFSPDGTKLYTDFTDLQGDSHVVEFPMNGDRPDTTARRELLFVHQPFPNHNGGQVVFGPDGMLYIGLGDGGSAGDPNGNGQNTRALLGKILRIDPAGRTGDKPYAIPAGNPFADGADGAPEVWLYGVRNPWRFTFDRSSGDLWIGDVGQDRVEEVDRLPAATEGAGRGANLGWNRAEGAQPYKGGKIPAGAVPPVFEYEHDDGNCSVTGGYVYRGTAVPALVGVYVFADYCVGDIRGLLDRNGAKLDERSLGLEVPGTFVTSFGQDDAGELYVLAGAGGIYRIDRR